MQSSWRSDRSSPQPSELVIGSPLALIGLSTGVRFPPRLLTLSIIYLPPALPACFVDLLSWHIMAEIRHFFHSATPPSFLTRLMRPLLFLVRKTGEAEGGIQPAQVRAQRRRHRLHQRPQQALQQEDQARVRQIHGGDQAKPRERHCALKTKTEARKGHTFWRRKLAGRARQLSIKGCFFFWPIIWAWCVASVRVVLLCWGRGGAPRSAFKRPSQQAMETAS